TASADSPDATGYCDIAVGWYRGPASDLEREREAVRKHWASLKRQGQARWEYLFDEGALDELESTALGDLVWPRVLEEGVSGQCVSNCRILPPWPMTGAMRSVTWRSWAACRAERCGITFRKDCFPHLTASGAGTTMAPSTSSGC